MAALRARFIVTSRTRLARRGSMDITLRATKQADAANSENPVLFADDESSANTINLRIKGSQADTVFQKGKEVYVDFNGPI